MGWAPITPFGDLKLYMHTVYGVVPACGAGMIESCHTVDCFSIVHTECSQAVYTSAWHNMERLRAKAARRGPLLGGLIRPPRVAHDVLDVCGIGACEQLDGEHART